MLLVGARPASDGKAILLHLREIGGKNGQAVLRSPSGKSLSCQDVDVLGSRLGAIEKGVVPMNTQQVRWIRLELLDSLQKD